MLLTCLFESTPKTYPNPLDLRLLHSVPVSKPTQGEINALDPLPGPLSGALAISADLHSPSGRLNLPDQSVRLVSLARSSPHETFDCLLLPAAFSFNHAPDQCSKLASSRLAIVGTIERTTGMLGVRSADGRSGFGVCHSPATLFSVRRVVATNAPSADLHPTGAGNSERPFARS